MTGTVESVLTVGAKLGEGALWDNARHCVWFVDIKGKKLHRFDPANGAHDSHDAPQEIGWALPAEDGRILTGQTDGLYWFDPSTGAFTFWQAVPGEPAGNRLNDACTDPAGRVWFGSMDNGESADTGRFYCLERGTIRPAGPDKVSITNGPAVSGDGRTIYFTDTLARRISKATILDDGALGPVSTFVQLGEADGYTDGPVVDAEGCVWTGLYAGWGIKRFAPDGKLLETVTLPVANVTKMAFGGPDLKTVYVTTAAKGLAPNELAVQPLAGNLFSFRADVAGVATTPVRL